MLEKGERPAMSDAIPSPRNWLFRYGAAVAIAVIGLVIRGLLPIQPGLTLYTLALSAVVVSAWFGGRGPGLLAMVLSVLGIDYFLIPPTFTFTIYPEYWVGFGVFTGAALFLIEFAAAQRSSQLALRESEERFRLVASNLPEVIWIHSLRPERVLYVSPSFERVWGRPALELLENPKLWVEGIDQRDRDRVAKNFDQWLAGEANDFDLEYRLVRPDGTVRWIHDHGVLIRNDQGLVSGACGIAEDVSERKEMEDHLRASEAQWRAAFENSPTMYLMVDAEGITRSVNPFGAQKLGYTVGELVGRPVLDVFHPEDREAVIRNCAACVERLGEILHWELRKVRKDGQVIWVRESARAMRGPEGHPIILVACEDITDAEHTAETLAKV